MNFAAVDLNLLRVFDAMMLELSTVRAGERVALSQNEVSAAIGRLRHLAGDELFVREGDRMAPTPRALQLSAPWREALRQIESALAVTVGFDPATAQDTFTVLAPDHVATMLAPRLATALTREAPGVGAKIMDQPLSHAFRMLREGLADVVIDRASDGPDWLMSELLFHSDIVCVARTRHTSLALAARPGERLPAGLYCGSGHVIMSGDGGRRGSIDPILEKSGFARRVAITVPSFEAVALAAADSDLIGSLPFHVARQAASLLDLEVYLPPFDVPGVDFRVYWHRRLDQDPANRWIRGVVTKALGRVAAAVPAAVATPTTDAQRFAASVLR